MSYGTGYHSDCCDAPIDPDVGICLKCKEHAEALENE
jgi:hypothetical protein